MIWRSEVAEGAGAVARPAPGMPNMDLQARVEFSAHGSFKRSDFGIAYGVPAPSTAMGVGDLIDLDRSGTHWTASGNSGRSDPTLNHQQW